MHCFVAEHIDFESTDLIVDRIVKSSLACPPQPQRNLGLQVTLDYQPKDSGRFQIVAVMHDDRLPLICHLHAPADTDDNTDLVRLADGSRQSTDLQEPVIPVVDYRLDELMPPNKSAIDVHQFSVNNHDDEDIDRPTNLDFEGIAIDDQDIAMADDRLQSDLVVFKTGTDQPQADPDGDRFYSVVEDSRLLHHPSPLTLGSDLADEMLCLAMHDDIRIPVNSEGGRTLANRYQGCCDEDTDRYEICQPPSNSVIFCLLEQWEAVEMDCSKLSQRKEDQSEEEEEGLDRRESEERGETGRRLLAMILTAGRRIDN